MPCIPKKTIDDIVASGNHYLVQVKGNQPTLQNQMQSLLLGPLIDMFEESQKCHGRHSTWTISVYDASRCGKASEWRDLRRLIHVHRQVEYTKNGEVVHSDRLYICDLHMTDASYYAKAIRGHWAIENRLHWVKDVRHGEDDNGIGEENAAMNISTLSSIALNLHRINGRDKIKNAQIFSAANCRKIICELRT